MAWTKWRHFLGVGATVALVAVIGTIGLMTSNAARSQAASTHREDRLLLQRTLSGLVAGYVRSSLREAYEFASTGPWSLAPDAEADKARLASFVGRSAVHNHGAALLSLTGQPLTFFAREPGLPPATDPGYAPMRRSLLAGRPGLSSVMRVGNTNVVAAAVPVEMGGTRVALLVAYSRIASTPLQTQAERLTFGPASLGMVVDASGRVVAAGRPELLGTLVESPAVPGSSQEWGTGFLSFTRDGQELVTSYSPVGVGGWGLVAEQSRKAFYGPLEASARRVQLSMLAGLIFASISLVVVVGRRHRLLRRDAEELKAREERTRQILDTATDAFVAMDREGIVTEWNLQAERVFGWLRSEAIGKPVIELIIPPEERGVHRHGLTWILTTGESQMLGQRVELTGLHRSGQRLQVELTISAVGQGDQISFNAFIHDISERKEAERRLQVLALHDFLTGLPNRVLIMDRMRLALARSRRSEAKVALLFLDLDDFKAVNDSLGHDAGDELLIVVADRLKGTLRPSDTAGRLGGDEFVVLCDGVSDDEALAALVQRVREAVAQPCAIRGVTVDVRVSVGAAMAHGDADPESLLRAADSAMYDRKKLARAQAV